MKNKIFKLLPYLLFTIISIIFVMFTNINNIYCISVIYISISLHLIFNYYKKKKLDYKRYLYLLWILLSVMLILFFFSLINIIIFTILLIFIVIQYILNKEKKEDIEIDKPVLKPKKNIINTELPDGFNVDEFEKIVKELYVDMQTFFMNLNYEKLKNILCDDMYKQFSSQMNYLEKNNKRAIRDNIEFIDFKINEYKKINDLEIIKVSIGVYEDKYTKYLNNDSLTRLMRYENYYELLLENSEKWVISNLKILYSHSKKD